MTKQVKLVAIFGLFINGRWGLGPKIWKGKANTWVFSHPRHSVFSQTSFIYIRLHFHSASQLIPKPLFLPFLVMLHHSSNPQKMVEEVGGGFQVKKWGVIPPNRRSVKRMMLHKFLISASSLFRACFHPVVHPNNCCSKHSRIFATKIPAPY